MLTTALAAIILSCVSENVVAAGATFQSAERVLALLTSFDDSRPEQGVTELARTIGVHKSTASRLAAVHRSISSEALVTEENRVVVRRYLQTRRDVTDRINLISNT